MIFSKFSTAKFIGPRKDTQHGYPLDLDGSLRFTRPYVIDNFPYPTTGPLSGMNGATMEVISGFMRQANNFFLTQYNTARKPYGPNINAVPNYGEMGIAVPGLTKRN